MILTATTKYLNSNIIPALGGVVVAGLMFRLIYELQKSHNEDEPIKVALKKSKKYIVLIIMTTILSATIAVIQSYYK